MDKKLCFSKICLKAIEKMKNFVCRVDFSGIQGFIYQNDSMESLNEITRRSEYIQQLSVKINEELTGILKEYLYTPITVSSGKIQAILKTIRDAARVFESHLKNIQEIVFLEYQGRIQIFYGVTYAWIRNKTPADIIVLFLH